MGAHFREDGKRLVARPQGRMGAAEGADFASAAEQNLHAGTSLLTIDLEDVEHIGLGGIRAILRLARSLKENEQTVEFANGDDRVREALHQAGFDHLFAFTPPYHPHRGTQS
jgi:anti-anti-sigma factor